MATARSAAERKPNIPDEASAPVGLRCEYLTNPLGIDAVRPGLSWRSESNQRGDRQTAYQVLVASSPARLAGDQGDLWDSGKIESNQSVQILYAGQELASQMRCHWKVRVWDKDGRPTDWSQPAFWTMGLLSETDWQGCWIGAREGTPPEERRPRRELDRTKVTYDIDPADAPAVLLRRQMMLGQRPVRATAYICGLGYYELYVNGQRVGDRLLDPAYSDYTKRVLYVTYDVSALVKSGENVLGVMLGNGFYCLQTPDLFQLENAPWRTPPRMRMKLVVEFEDGSSDTIVSDGQWKWSTGAIVFNCIRGGETIDARQEAGRWLEHGYDDSGWKPAVDVTAPSGRLAAQTILPIRVNGQLAVQRITEPKPGVYIADFGGNLTGWVRLSISGRRGQVVTLDHNEVLNDDGTLNLTHQATHTYGRYQHQECILAGTEREVFEPRFTYHAFRYVEIRGLEHPLKAEDLVAIRMHTQLPRVGEFECSDPSINLLHNAARRTLEDCAWGSVTAEPVREKVIWIGDNTSCLDAYCYMFDCAQLYRKMLDDVSRAQDTTGHYPPVIPSGGWGELGSPDRPAYPCAESDYTAERSGTPVKFHFCDSPWNGTATCLVAERLDSGYGDRTTLARSYETCRHYVDFLTSTAKDGIVGWGLPDWLRRPGSELTGTELISTVYYKHQAQLVAEMATRLGKKEDAAKYRALAESIRETFNRKFFDPAAGCYRPMTQTAQAMPLAFDLVPTAERKRVLASLVETVRAAGNMLTAGFMGTMPTFDVLTDAGYGDLAYEILTEGWFHMLTEGESSTLGESPYARRGGYGSGHHQFGACVAGWMYRCLAGIRLESAHQIVIQPAILTKLTWVKAHYDSVYGRIASHWSRDGDQLTMTVTIPANTTATVHVPAKDAAAVTARDATFLRMERDAALFAVESGTYKFTSKLA
jgi:alpha-L-rhamnosidase